MLSHKVHAGYNESFFAMDDSSTREVEVQGEKLAVSHRFLTSHFDVCHAALAKTKLISPCVFSVKSGTLRRYVGTCTVGVGRLQ